MRTLQWTRKKYNRFLGIVSYKCTCHSRGVPSSIESAIVGGFTGSNCSRQHIGRSSLFPAINPAAKILARSENCGFISVFCRGKDRRDILLLLFFFFSLFLIFLFLSLIIARPPGAVPGVHQFSFFSFSSFFSYR